LDLNAKDPETLNEDMHGDARERNGLSLRGEDKLRP
jgi:hypothetical protein